jgi:thioredoxin 1
MEITKEDFKEKVEDFSGLILVSFYANWCAPCLVMKMTVDELIKDYEGSKIKIAKINIDEAGEYKEKYQVMSIPTIIIFKTGKEVERKIGLRDKEEVIKMINKFLD